MMKYCIECGTDRVILKIPEGDNRSRYICKVCDYIHYQNPRMICGTLPIHNGKILLCKRAIEPRYGLWTLPAGFMENGETLEAAAARETYEESLARSIDSNLYCIFSLPHINQIHIFYKCNIENGDFGAGSETLEASLYAIEDIPWDQLAFRTVARCIKHYVKDKDSGEFGIHVEDIVLPPPSETG